MWKIVWSIVLLSLAVIGEPNAQQPTSSASDVFVFAAASLQTALDAIAPAAERATGVQMRVSYAASSALARQIENGAPADLFISADLDWMDYLADRQLIRTDTRVNLLGNRLVLIAPRAQPDCAEDCAGISRWRPRSAATGWRWRIRRRCRPASTRGRR